MLPTQMRSTADELIAQFRTSLDRDAQAASIPDLLSAEQTVVAFVHQLGLGMLQAFVDVRAEQAKANRRSCRCGSMPEVHRTTTWTRQSPFGALSVRDPYLYCRSCHDSMRPLHVLLGTDRETWSPLVQEAAVDLASDESCGKAVAKLARHHPGVEMDRTTALRMLHHHGEQARAFINDKLAKARETIGLPPAQRPKGAEEMEVQFDGGMIPVATLEPIQLEEGQQPELTAVRGLPKRKKVCRWEECKVGLVQIPGEVDRLYSVQPTDGLDKSFKDLFSLASLKGLTESTEVRGIADGALHIRPRMEAAFAAGNFRFILDRPHCKEHLSNTGDALQLECIISMPSQEWASAALSKLELGQSSDVITELKKAWECSGPDERSRNDTLRLEMNYLRRNRDAVAYARYREQGWSTASSEVESGHRHVVQCRVKISGAWWHPDNVDHILALRMLKANGWWDEYWANDRKEWRLNAERIATKG